MFENGASVSRTNLRHDRLFIGRAARLVSNTIEDDSHDRRRVNGMPCDLFKQLIRQFKDPGNRFLNVRQTESRKILRERDDYIMLACEQSILGCQINIRRAIDKDELVLRRQSIERVFEEN